MAKKATARKAAGKTVEALKHDDAKRKNIPSAELQAVLNDPVVRDKLQALGIDASPGTPEQFAEQMRRDLARYGQVVKAANIRLE